MAIVLGFGLLYDHGDSPNAEAIRNYDEMVVEFVAIKEIEPGDEITHRYHCPVWFKLAA